MIEVRRAGARFHTALDWLDSWHSFAFGPHYNEAHVQFGPLRVLNDDTVAPGGGFGTHRHAEMEIVSLVLEGALAHKDSTGGEEVLREGEVQAMSAGRGVSHSEYNASDEAPVKFLQVWLLPSTARLTPAYAQRDFSAVDRRDKLVPVVSGRGHAGALTLHQDAALFLGSLGKGASVRHALPTRRRAYLFTIAGSISVEGERLGARDGARIQGLESMAIEAGEPAELLLIDLP